MPPWQLRASALITALAVVVGTWATLHTLQGGAVIAVEEPWVQLYDPSRHSEVLGKTPGVKRHLFVFAASAAQGQKLASRLANSAREHFHHNDNTFRQQHLLVDGADRANRHVLDDFGLSATDLELQHRAAHGHPNLSGGADALEQRDPRRRCLGG